MKYLSQRHEIPTWKLGPEKEATAVVTDTIKVALDTMLI
jgi:hypothetical protein